MPRGIKLMADDVWSKHGATFCRRKCSSRSFTGQTKEKLSNRDALKLVSTMVRDPFELWLNSHVDCGRKIAELVIRQAVERSRSVQKVERKKSSSVVILPEKLTDCESTNSTTTSCSSSKAIRPAARRSRRATSASRRFTRCAARR